MSNQKASIGAKILIGFVVAISGIEFVSTNHAKPSSAQIAVVSPSQGPKGATGNTGTTGATGSAGTNGTNGSAATISVGTTATLSPGASATVSNSGGTSAAVFNFGIPAGVAGVNALGSPTTRTLSLATAYQCTDNTKPCIATINLQSTATISLSGGATNTGNALIGSTNGVATGTGSILCVHGNSNTGALTIGLNLSTIATTQCTMPVPTGWYFSVRQIAGTVSILSAFDQSVG